MVRSYRWLSEKHVITDLPLFGGVFWVFQTILSDFATSPRYHMGETPIFGFAWPISVVSTKRQIWRHDEIFLQH